MPTRVVADTASDLPAHVADAAGVRLVGLTVGIGDQTFVDGRDLSPEDFWDRFEQSDVAPTTAPPTADSLLAAYDDLAEQGADAVVSVHLSSKVSDTCAVAREAAGRAKVPVHVVDSLAVSAATGLLALHAADLASGGATAAEIVDSVEAMKRRVHLFATVDTLDHLRRGRRIGGAQAMLGTMLQVKPIITLQEGVVEAAGRVRTRRRALEELARIVGDHAPGIERLVVVHGRANDVGDLVSLVSAHHHVRDVWCLGPVVGAHTGPGTIGVVFAGAAATAG